MDGIAVGIFDEHEVFAHGVSAILRDDPMVDSVTADLGDAGEVDVATTSVSFIGHEAINCPVVAFASPNDVPPTALTSQGVVALLSREEITPEQLRSAVHAAASGLRIHWEPTARGVLDERSRAVLRLNRRGGTERRHHEKWCSQESK